MALRGLLWRSPVSFCEHWNLNLKLTEKWSMHCCTVGQWTVQQWTVEFESTHMIRKWVEGQLMFAQLFIVKNKWVHVCKKTWVCLLLHTHAPHWSSFYCFFFCLVFSFHFRTSGVFYPCMGKSYLMRYKLLVISVANPNKTNLITVYSNTTFQVHREKSQPLNKQWVTVQIKTLTFFYWNRKHFWKQIFKDKFDFVSPRWDFN